MSSPYTLIDTLYMYADQHAPDDPVFLKIFPEVKEENRHIKEIVQSRTETPEVKLIALLDFLYQWFPDSISDEEQDEITAHMDAAEAWLKQNKEKS